MPKTEHTNQRTFYNLLANTLVASLTNFTVWFAITFFVFLQTRSVFATAVIAGIYLVITAISGIWFGSLVDHNKKKKIMLVSSLTSFVVYCASLVVYLIVGPDAFKDPTSIVLWTFVPLLMVGVMVGNIRTIALSTTITILVPEDRRDRANGLVGTTWGIAFLLTSVISGILVGQAGLLYVLWMAIGLTGLAIAHLWTLTIPEKGIAHVEGEAAPKKIDLKGTFAVVKAVPGLLALILFATFNNFLGGVYMSLMDAYGLSLVSVETWGFLWGVLSVGFIVGGIIISKKGLGKNPLRSLFIANIIIWAISSVFTIQSSIFLLGIGMFVYLSIMPFIEASEQTIMQKVVPHERQGRIFGFAQSVEQAASPLTAFIIGPIVQFIFIPYMTDGAGADLIGSWFGTGPARGIALAFTITGLIGLAMTLLAMRSKYYRQLSERYLQS
ncbi:MAG TPA: MFS transporter [Candidatus Saccharimonadales bacterium]|nr:MFS transporter [Candidatus Saccharimonadales bacterium]